ncbi:MAG: presenilin family intramembrane aspartyl protease, partial [Patescibacteria group bacterium]
MKFKLPLFLRILLLFGLTQLAGIYAAYKFLPELEPAQPMRFSGFSFYDFVILVVFVLFLVFIIRRFKLVSSVFFKIFLTIVAFAGAQAMLAIWLSPLASTLAAVLLLFLFWSFNNVFLQDLMMILTFAGVGAVLGVSITPGTVVLILIVLSFYDIIAVYKTRHMVELAKAMIRSRAIFGFVVPVSFGGFKERMERVSPGEQFMILGSGDVILPLLLSASLVRASINQAVIVALFSALGLFFMHLIFTNQKIRRPMAALPPIA